MAMVVLRLLQFSIMSVSRHLLWDKAGRFDLVPQLAMSRFIDPRGELSIQDARYLAETPFAIFLEESVHDSFAIEADAAA